jgi:hypothetical protein
MYKGESLFLKALHSRTKGRAFEHYEIASKSWMKHPGSMSIWMKASQLPLREDLKGAPPVLLAYWFANFNLKGILHPPTH